MEDNQNDAPVAPSPATLSVRVSDAMRLTGIGKTKMFELIASGALETVLVGRRRLILYASLQDFILGGGIKAPGCAGYDDAPGRSMSGG